jgi:hypothetical protein
VTQALGYTDDTNLTGEDINTINIKIEIPFSLE